TKKSQQKTSRIHHISTTVFTLHQQNVHHKDCHVNDRAQQGCYRDTIQAGQGAGGILPIERAIDWTLTAVMEHTLKASRALIKHLKSQPAKATEKRNLLADK